MAFPNLTDLIATTLEARSADLADNVTKNNAILAQFKKKGRIKTVSGGRTIYEAFTFAENGNAASYSGYDILPTSPQDVISGAEYEWKQYACPVVISGRERLINSGKEALIDLLEGRIEAAESTMQNLISDGIYGDGTGNGSKDITGLGAAIPVDPTTGTYGGINRANYTFWRSYALDTNAAPSSTTIQGHFNTAWSNLVRGSDRPDLIMVDSTVWAAYMASLQAQQRFTGVDTASLGFPSVLYMDCPVVLDGGIGGFMDAATALFLNTKYLKYRPHSQRNMVPLDPSSRSPHNQDASVQILGWMGNLTCSGAQFQGRITFS